MLILYKITGFGPKFTTKREKGRKMYAQNSLFFSVSFPQCMIILLSLLLHMSDGKSINELHTKFNCSKSNLDFIHVNKDVDPCVDFYQYVCGNFKQNCGENTNQFLITEGSVHEGLKRFLAKPSDNNDPFFVNETRKFYASCLDVESIKKNSMSTFDELLNTTGFIIDKKNKSIYSKNWLTTLAKMDKYTGVNPFFNFKINPSKNEIGEYRIFITVVQSGVNISTKNIVSPINYIKEYEPDPAQTLIKIYKEYGIDYKMDEINESAEKINFLTHQIKNFSDGLPLSIMNGTLENLQMHLDQMMKSKKSKINFNDFVKTMFKDLNNVDYKSKLDVVYLETIFYFGNLSQLLETMNDKDISMFLLVQLYHNFLSELDITSHVRNNVLNPSSRCLEDVKLYLDYGAGYFLVKKAETDIPKVETIVKNIRNEFFSILKNVTWMEKRMKNESLEKLLNMKSQVGIPKIIQNSTYIKLVYSDSIKEKLYLKSKINIIRRKNEFNLRLLGESGKNLNDSHVINEFEFLEVNAAYKLYLNMMEYQLMMTIDRLKPVMHIHLGIMQQTFIANESVLNYGAIGDIIGHELNHGFDTTGIYFDRYGNFIQWTNESTKEYEKRTLCYEKQYSKFVIPGTNKTLDGKKTLGENIADNGGILVAYKAFKKALSKGNVIPTIDKYTNEQLFFMKYANIWCTSTPYTTDEHSPHEARTNLVLRNLKEFSDAWKCPSESPMNPVDKCVLWD